MRFHALEFTALSILSSLVSAQDPSIVLTSTEAQIVIPYPYRAYIVHLTAGNCDETSSGVATSQDVSTLDISLTMNIVDCGLSASSDATFQVGGVDLGTELTLAEYTVNLASEATFAITYSYGSVNKDTLTIIDSNGVSNNVQFLFEEYDSTFTTPTVNANKIAGQPIYLGISVMSGDFDHDAYNFAVTTCKIYPKDDDSIQYTFYDYERDTCDNDLIGLDVTYDAASKMWRVNHLLFLLNGQNGVELQIECEVKVCHKLFESTCRAAASSCQGCTKTCNNGGTCMLDGDLTTENCNCVLPYTGDSCDTELTPPCDADPCNSVAIPGIGASSCENSADLLSYTCICVNGWTDDTCGTPIACILNTPCQNGGTCIPQANFISYDCDCLDGYTGGNCETIVNTACDVNPCQNSGTCATVDGTSDQYECTCGATYIGTNCETPLPCETADALGTPLCTAPQDVCMNSDDLSTHTCSCADPTKVGVNCDQPAPCVPNPCHNDGMCTNVDETTYSCACPEPWFGPVCAFGDACQTLPAVFIEQQCPGGSECEPIVTGDINDPTSTASFTCVNCPDSFGNNCSGWGCAFCDP